LFNTEKMLRAQVIRQQNTLTVDIKTVTICNNKQYEKLHKNETTISDIYQ